MMGKKTCAFTGHRIVSDYIKIREVLRDKLRELINDGYTVFYNGGAIGFDAFCALEVINLKKEFNIKLNLILPCKKQDEKWNERQKNIYKFILDNSDSIEYVSEKYENGCMQKRNRLLCERSDLLFAYLKSESGGTYYTVNYAKKIGKDVFNIANALTNA